MSDSSYHSYIEYLKTPHTTHIETLKIQIHIQSRMASQRMRVAISKEFY